MSTAVEFACPIAGVIRAREVCRQSHGWAITERLYECADGWSLGVRRGGPLHLADESTWEMFVLDHGLAHGDPVGYVTDEQLTRAVNRLAELAAA